MRKDRQILAVLGKAKKLAQQYRALTGKPLGITGEVAEYQAARLLKVKLTIARNPGYDAIEHQGRRPRQLQIKGRCVLGGSKRSQRIGSIDIQKSWDAVLLVLLDEHLNAFEIYEAPRAKVIAAIKAPGSKARNDRGALSVNKFKAIGKPRWRRQPT